MYFVQHCFICRPSDSTVSEDAGIEPRTVATSAMAVRRSSHSATSHPRLGYISSTTRLHLIHDSATSHPLFGYISSNSATSRPRSATSHLRIVRVIARFSTIRIGRESFQPLAPYSRFYRTLFIIIKFTYLILSKVDAQMSANRKSANSWVQSAVANLEISEVCESAICKSANFPPKDR
jgi:hypothetical protein